LDLDKAKHNLGLAQKDIHDKTAEILILQKDLFDLTGEVTTAKSDLASMERDRDDWQRKHGAVESDLNTAKSHLKTAASDLHTANSKASHFESEVKRLDLELATAKSTGSSTVSSIQLALDDATKDLKDARLEVLAREKDISLLQDQVHEVQVPFFL
jgi:chromosome segregation ATPase